MRSITYYGNSWIGMFIKANDSLAFAPVDLLDKSRDVVKSILGINIVNICIGDSNLLGLYLTMNSNGLIVPNISTQEEVGKLQKLGLNVYKTEEKNNANGNNLCINDRGGVINEHVSPIERKKMEDTLGIELVPMTIANYFTVGSCCLATNKGFMSHYKTTEEEMKLLESIFKVKGNKGTVNTGVGFVGIGLIANTKGYVTGEQTTPFEMGRVEESLGFI
ncbi:translation initiation factor IF-6 [Candidatus Micrarchaeota archaeon]|nr:translation initiation factor IF-6 [Candidatus Micrarchaeota archaeon]